jgi:hypothetical protein
VPEAFIIGDFNATVPIRVPLPKIADALLTYRDTPVAI